MYTYLKCNSLTLDVCVHPWNGNYHHSQDEHICVCAKSFQSYPTLCNLLDHSLPGSSVHGIALARILEWFAMPSSRGSSQPGYRTLISCIASRFFTCWATGEAHEPICHPEMFPGAFFWFVLASLFSFPAFLSSLICFLSL